MSMAELKAKTTKKEPELFIWKIPFKVIPLRTI